MVERYKKVDTDGAEKLHRVNEGVRSEGTRNDHLRDAKTYIRKAHEVAQKGEVKRGGPGQPLGSVSPKRGPSDPSRLSPTHFPKNLLKTLQTQR